MNIIISLVFHPGTYEENEGAPRRGSPVVECLGGVLGLLQVPSAAYPRQEVVHLLEHKTVRVIKSICIDHMN